jgi:hypothetical protein
VTERKMCNTHLLEVGRLHLTARKRAKKGEKARKMTERKMSNMHLLETDKANFKGCGKKGGKRVRRVRKGRKERWTICIY